MPTPAPLPTPYDITPIPLFPIIPGPLAWLLVALLAFAVAAVIARIPFLRRGSPSSAIAAALKELRSLGKKNLPPRELLTASSLVVRRLLNSIAGLNVRSATAHEIRALAETQPEAVQPLLRAAANVEDARFLPEISSERAAKAIQVLTDTLQRAQEHFQQAGGAG